MLTSVVESALNDQINHELTSWYGYLAMSSSAASMSMTGTSHWLRVQAQEEHAHALRLMDYMLERDGQVRLREVLEPRREWSSLLEMFEAASEEEMAVWEGIDRLVDIAIQEKDRATQTFLGWFETEQVEEMNLTKQVLARLQLVSDAPVGLLLIDNELGARAAGK